MTMGLTLNEAASLCTSPPRSTGLLQRIPVSFEESAIWIQIERDLKIPHDQQPVSPFVAWLKSRRSSEQHTLMAMWHSKKIAIANEGLSTYEPFADVGTVRGDGNQFTPDGELCLFLLLHVCKSLGVQPSAPWMVNAAGRYFFYRGVEPNIKRRSSGQHISIAKAAEDLFRTIQTVLTHEALTQLTPIVGSRELVERTAEIVPIPVRSKHKPAKEQDRTSMVVKHLTGGQWSPKLDSEPHCEATQQHNAEWKNAKPWYLPALTPLTAILFDLNLRAILDTE